MNCAIARFGVGVMQTDSGGCIASNIIMNLMFAVIISMIVVRYLMAILFQWVISRRLVKPGGRSNWLAWRSVQGGNADPKNHIRGPYNNYSMRNQSSSNMTTPKASPHGTGSGIFTQQPASYQVPKYPTPRSSSVFNSSTTLQRPLSTTLAPPPTLPSGNPNRNSSANVPSNHNLGHYQSNNPVQLHSSTSLATSRSSSSITAPVSPVPHQQHHQPASSEIVQTELYTCMLVTCYSEGEEGLRITMDSLAETTYSNKHKVESPTQPYLALLSWKVVNWFPLPTLLRSSLLLLMALLLVRGKRNQHQTSWWIWWILIQAWLIPLLSVTLPSLMVKSNLIWPKW